MTWFWLALASAFCLASSDYVVRRHFRDLPLGEVVAVRVLGVVPVALAIFVLTPTPAIEPGFWWACGLALPLEVAALLLYLRALQLSPLGLTQPFMASTPLFVVFTGWVVLGESLSPGGLTGVALLAAGAYGLNLHAARRGWLGPIKAVASEPGSWRMLLAALLYGIIAVLGKKAVLHSSPWFMAGAYPLVFCLTMLAALWATGRLGWSWARKPGAALLVGLSMAGMLLTHFQAISMAPAAYMLAVKRMSTLMAVLYGGVLLGEGRLGQHLAACALMVAGAALVLVLG